ncbi:transposase [Arachidicoccus terrestris]|uniref:transposase n=1 Tax=Arachidicoccus terrestris TaxID=2875539 RepID=UPI003743EEBA|nr:transposase [Arachidicoccus terrestris]
MVVDRFHVQQLASEAVQEIRIKYRWPVAGAGPGKQADRRGKKTRKAICTRSFGQRRHAKTTAGKSQISVIQATEQVGILTSPAAGFIFEGYPAIKKLMILHRNLVPYSANAPAKNRPLKG